jgi:hypothetical protein
MGFKQMTKHFLYSPWFYACIQAGISKRASGKCEYVTVPGIDHMRPIRCLNLANFNEKKGKMRNASHIILTYTDNMPNQLQ